MRCLIHPRPLPLVAAGLLALLVPAVAMAGSFSLELPVTRLEVPTPPPGTTSGLSAGFGTGLGIQEVLSYDQPDDREFKPSIAAQLRTEVRLSDRIAAGFGMPAWPFGAGHIKVTLADGNARPGTWDAGATFRYGRGTHDDSGEDWEASGFSCIFGYSGALGRRWKRHYKATLTDAALVFGRAASARGSYFGGPFISRIEYSAGSYEANVYCGGEQPVTDVRNDGTTSVRGVNLGYTRRYGQGRLLFEIAFAELRDGALRDQTVRLTFGADALFGW